MSMNNTVGGTGGTQRGSREGSSRRARVAPDRRIASMSVRATGIALKRACLVLLVWDYRPVLPRNTELRDDAVGRFRN
jgi:hypothetical protein